MNNKKSLILAFYCIGIIVGGGILALPLVSIDTGAIALIALLIILGIVFYLIYLRLLQSVSTALRGKIVLRTGLTLYDEGLRYSGLARFGGLAFTIGLALYTLPADLVYVLYGMKSLLQLSLYASFNTILEMLFIGITIIFASLIIFTVYSKKEIFTGTTSLDLVLKISLMIGIWAITIGLLGLTASSELKVTLATTAFVISLIIGEYYPERFFKARIGLRIEDDVLPRHKASSYLTIFKISLIIGTPLIAFLILLQQNKLTTYILLLPKSIEALVAATSIIIFMYVGSGIYNILIYDWVIKCKKTGKQIVLLAVLLSISTYIIFTLLILLSVDPSILIYSSIEREHAFIALSRKLEEIGLSVIGLIVIIIANVFALVSVSIAYMGFTDTMADRLSLDIRVNRETVWFFITFITLVSVILLEINDVSKIATDALGIAGNAGGGLFLLILPWLMKDSKSRRRISLGIIFMIIITILNLFIIRESYSMIAKIIGGISTILVLVISILVILEARKPKIREI